MDHKIPITDIDKIVYSNIIINKNNIKYNINELYKNIDLHILIKNVNIQILKFNDDYIITTTNIKMINLRNKFDELIQENNKKYPDIKFNNLDKRASYVKLNFLDNISKAYINSKKEEKTTILVKTYEDFVKTYNNYYKVRETLSADIIIKPYTTGYNNFVSFSIYDIEISPKFQCKNIIKKNISYQEQSKEMTIII